MSAARLAVIVSAGLAACVELDLEPDVGPRLAGTCDDDDSDPLTDVSYAYDIQPLLTRPMGGCNCHMPTQSSLASNLDLGSFPTMRRGGATAALRIVIDGKPCDSVVYQKVADTPPFGSRMPLGGPQFFTAEERRTLHDWIAEGALDN